MRCAVLVSRAPIVRASRHAAVVALPPQIHVALREDVVLEPARAVARLPAAIPLTLGALGNRVRPSGQSWPRGTGLIEGKKHKGRRQEAHMGMHR